MAAQPADGEADGLGVLDEQVVGLRERGPSAGEADDQDAAERRHAAHRFVEHVAAHRIEDHVGAAPVGERLHLFAEAVAVVDGVIGAEFAHHGELVVGASRGDHRGAHELADVHGGQADPASRAMHEQRFASLQAATLHGVERSGVVGTKRRRLFQIDAARNGRGALRIHHHALHAARWHEHRVAHREPVHVAPDCGHFARAFAADHERQRRLHLVPATAHQHIGERHAPRRHRDFDLPRPGRPGFGDFSNHQRFRPVMGLAVHRLHTPLPLERPRKTTAPKRPICWAWRCHRP